MKTPYKIYLERILCSDEVYDTWKSQKTISDDIEYIRTDAFIEKACEWLKESITNNPECNRIISKKGVITMGELIEDFRNYMKGE